MKWLLKFSYDDWKFIVITETHLYWLNFCDIHWNYIIMIEVQL